MRSVLSLAAASLALAACQSDENFKQQWREATINVCLQEARNRPMPAGVDADRVCACSIDRLMQGKTVAQLSNGPEMQREAEAAARQCAVEAMGASADAAAGNAASNASGEAGTR